MLITLFSVENDRKKRPYCCIFVLTLFGVVQQRIAVNKLMAMVILGSRLIRKAKKPLRIPSAIQTEALVLLTGLTCVYSFLILFRSDEDEFEGWCV
ncbi:Uncharacterised protein [Legionella steigerwaltii]|uniref:Uncharacterized protein n=1 Tax=Legionella steigerwaltii TaxID=460 RepID=A0A378L8J0_9GAMM|nr:hypothetical protein Lstg_2091 [Legionella steigerwaltii]STY23044.1 Uncharacterised protein [Legionella steigerwaltii]